MPTKTTSLFDTEFSEPPKEKKPTLLQYLKTLKDAKYPLVFRIEIVWFPGKFDNYTLETTDFRCQVSPSNPLYKVLDKIGYKTFKDSSSAILLNVVDETARISLGESNYYGSYTDISTLGVKFKPTDGAN